MWTQRTRHRLLQRIFWNSVGARVVERLVRFERMFDVVVRNYSLIGETNGERWFLSMLDDEPVVFDVGYHEGAFTSDVLRARPRGRVIGFDPSAFASDSYQRRFATDQRVSLEQLALSNAPGEMDFYDYDHMCNSLAARKEGLTTPRIYTVPVATLDDYCSGQKIEHINLLKIDAEGFDLHVLEGARALLAAQGVDLFVFEFASGWAASKRYLWEAVELIDALPYTLFRLFNGFLCPFTYDVTFDSSCTLSAMYVGVSHERMRRGGIPLRPYRF